jgi:hypothetical protein
MNVRISDGTLRFRLGSADVSALRATGELNQRLPTGPDDGITFSLRLGGDWSISRGGDGIQVEGPRSPLSEWLDGPATELETRLSESGLRLLIEKDHHDL